MKAGKRQWNKLTYSPTGKSKKNVVESGNPNQIITDEEFEAKKYRAYISAINYNKEIEDTRRHWVKIFKKKHIQKTLERERLQKNKCFFTIPFNPSRQMFSLNDNNHNSNITNTGVNNNQRLNNTNSSSTINFTTSHQPNHK